MVSRVYKRNLATVAFVTHLSPLTEYSSVDFCR
jgi:hypothetical protein